jgi:hypothetical protein
MCIALAGCVTEEQRYTVQTVRDAQVQLRACQSILEANPHYARLYRKLAIDTVNEPLRLPTATQLSDTEIFSDSDKLEGYNWYSEAQPCLTPAFVSIGRIAPELQIYITDAQANYTEMLFRIMTNSYTFGQVNAEVGNYKQSVKVAAAAAVDNLRARWRQQEAEDVGENIGLTVGYVALAVATRGKMSFQLLGNRQAALARAQANYMRMHPGHIEFRRVRVVHCDGLGGSLTCVLTGPS